MKSLLFTWTFRTAVFTAGALAVLPPGNIFSAPTEDVNVQNKFVPNPLNKVYFKGKLLDSDDNGQSFLICLSNNGTTCIGGTKYNPDNAPLEPLNIDNTGLFFYEVKKTGKYKLIINPGKHNDEFEPYVTKEYNVPLSFFKQGSDKNINMDEPGMQGNKIVMTASPSPVPVSVAFTDPSGSGIKNISNVSFNKKGQNAYGNNSGSCEVTTQTVTIKSAEARVAVCELFIPKHLPSGEGNGPTQNFTINADVSLYDNGQIISKSTDLSIYNKKEKIFDKTGATSGQINSYNPIAVSLPGLPEPATVTITLGPDGENGATVKRMQGLLVNFPNGPNNQPQKLTIELLPQNAAANSNAAQVLEIDDNTGAKFDNLFEGTYDVTVTGPFIMPAHKQITISGDASKGVPVRPLDAGFRVKVLKEADGGAEALPVQDVLVFPPDGVRKLKKVGNLWVANELEKGKVYRIKIIPEDEGYGQVESSLAAKATYKGDAPYEFKLQRGFYVSGQVVDGSFEQTRERLENDLGLAQKRLQVLEQLENGEISFEDAEANIDYQPGVDNYAEVLEAELDKTEQKIEQLQDELAQINEQIADLPEQTDENSLEPIGPPLRDVNVNIGGYEVASSQDGSFLKFIPYEEIEDAGGGLSIVFSKQFFEDSVVEIQAETETMAGQTFRLGKVALYRGEKIEIDEEQLADIQGEGSKQPGVFWSDASPETIDADEDEWNVYYYPKAFDSFGSLAKWMDLWDYEVGKIGYTGLTALHGEVIYTKYFNEPICIKYSGATCVKELPFVTNRDLDALFLRVYGVEWERAGVKGLEPYDEDKLGPPSTLLSSREVLDAFGEYAQVLAGLNSGNGTVIASHETPPPGLSAQDNKFNGSYLTPGGEKYQEYSLLYSNTINTILPGYRALMKASFEDYLTKKIQEENPPTKINVEGYVIGQEADSEFAPDTWGEGAPQEAGGTNYFTITGLAGGGNPQSSNNPYKNITPPGTVVGGKPLENGQLREMVSNAKVILRRKGKSFSAITNNEGFFRIEDIPAGNYSIVIEHDVYEDQPGFEHTFGETAPAGSGGSPDGSGPSSGGAVTHKVATGLGSPDAIAERGVIVFTPVDGNFGFYIDKVAKFDFAGSVSKDTKIRQPTEEEKAILSGKRALIIENAVLNKTYQVSVKAETNQLKYDAVFSIKTLSSSGDGQGFNQYKTQYASTAVTAAAASVLSNPQPRGVSASHYKFFVWSAPADVGEDKDEVSGDANDVFIYPFGGKKAANLNEPGKGMAYGVVQSMSFSLEDNTDMVYSDFPFLKRAKGATVSLELGHNLDADEASFEGNEVAKYWLRYGEDNTGDGIDLLDADFDVEINFKEVKLRFLVYDDSDIQTEIRDFYFDSGDWRFFTKDDLNPGSEGVCSDTGQKILSWISAAPKGEGLRGIFDRDKILRTIKDTAIAFKSDGSTQFLKLIQLLQECEDSKSLKLTVCAAYVHGLQVGIGEGAVEIVTSLYDLAVLLGQLVSAIGNGVQYLVVEAADKIKQYLGDDPPENTIAQQLQTIFFSAQCVVPLATGNFSGSSCFLLIKAAYYEVKNAFEGALQRFSDTNWGEMIYEMSISDPKLIETVNSKYSPDNAQKTKELALWVGREYGVFIGKVVIEVIAGVLTAGIGAGIKAVSKAAKLSSKGAKLIQALNKMVEPFLIAVTRISAIITKISSGTFALFDKLKIGFEVVVNKATFKLYSRVEGKVRKRLLKRTKNNGADEIFEGVEEAGNRDIYKVTEGPDGSPVRTKVCPPGANCLVGDTTVWTDMGLVTIDKVDSRHNVLAVSDKTVRGPPRYKKVKQRLKTFASVLLVLSLQSGAEIQATSVHKFHTDKAGWLQAGAIRPGDCLSTLDDCTIVQSIRERKLEKPLPVYELSVAEYHTFVVGPDRVITHNAEPINCVDLEEKLFLENWVRPGGWRLPQNGTWSGVPGNSYFIPDDPTSLGLNPGDKIAFFKGRPFFSPWRKGFIEVEGLDGTGKDFSKIYKAIAEEKGFLKSDGTPNAAKAKQWLTDNQVTPHHAGGKIIEYIPWPLHGNPKKGFQGVRHQGGAYDLRQD